MNQTICILYGLNEGPGLAKNFLRACRDAGLTATQDPAKADIIFAHSGGCLLVPPINRAKMIVQVGVPYWPGRPWIVCTAIKMWREMQTYKQQSTLARWLRKTWWNLCYTANLRRHLRMMRNLSPSSPWNSTQHQYIIRNQDDAYCHPDIARRIAFRGPRTFISLPGGHDDCWLNPKPYVDLLQSHSTKGNT
jgi:hypothetical protein